MPERNSEKGSKLLSEYIGPIIPQRRGLAIDGRHFHQAIAVIGGGTGLEALYAARRFPEAAIVVVDPYVRFARAVITQLSRMDTRGGHYLFDWNFFLQDRELTGMLGLYDLAYVHSNVRGTWEALEAEFFKYRETAKRASGNIFLVEQDTSKVIPDQPIFNKIDLIYPYGLSTRDRSIYSFIAGGLKDQGNLRVVTDSMHMHYQYFLFGGDQVTSHGVVVRPNGVKHPQSAYDFVLGRERYQFVNITRNGELNPPTALQLFLRNHLPFALPGLIKMMRSDKRRLIRE